MLEPKRLLCARRTSFPLFLVKVKCHPMICLTKHRRGCVVSTTPPPHYHRERNGIHCTWGWTAWTGREYVSPRGAGCPHSPGRSMSLNRLRYYRRLIIWYLQDGKLDYRLMYPPAWFLINNIFKKNLVPCECT
jgi:hypothetical protein